MLNTNSFKYYGCEKNSLLQKVISLANQGVRFGIIFCNPGVFGEPENMKNGGFLIFFSDLSLTGVIEMEYRRNGYSRKGSINNGAISWM